MSGSFSRFFPFHFNIIKRCTLFSSLPVKLGRVCLMFFEASSQTRQDDGWSHISHPRQRATRSNYDTRLQDIPEKSGKTLLKCRVGRREFVRGAKSERCPPTICIRSRETHFFWVGLRAIISCRSALATGPPSLQFGRLMNNRQISTGHDHTNWRLLLRFPPNTNCLFETGFSAKWQTCTPRVRPLRNGFPNFQWGKEISTPRKTGKRHPRGCQGRN